MMSKENMFLQKTSTNEKNRFRIDGKIMIKCFNENIIFASRQQMLQKGNKNEGNKKQNRKNFLKVLKSSYINL